MLLVRHSQAILQNVNKASVLVRSRKDNVAGVKLPVFECYTDGSSGAAFRVLFMMRPVVV